MQRLHIKVVQAQVDSSTPDYWHLALISIYEGAHSSHSLQWEVDEDPAMCRLGTLGILSLLLLNRLPNGQTCRVQMYLKAA